MPATCAASLTVKSALEGMFGPLDVQPLSSQIWGFYTGLVYFTPIFGGLSGRPRARPAPHRHHRRRPDGDRPFHDGGRAAVPVRAVGAHSRQRRFKPNISTQVGGLYAPGDPRRDRAYSIFYVGINVGAFLAPLVCGTLGEKVGWHYGFAAAGVGMCIGLCDLSLRAAAAAAGRAAQGEGGACRATAARPRRMARHRRAARAVRAQHVVLGDLRADGQHHRAVGRRQHRPHASICSAGRRKFRPRGFSPSIRS